MPQTGKPAWPHLISRILGAWRSRGDGPDVDPFSTLIRDDLRSLSSFGGKVSEQFRRKAPRAASLGLNVAFLWRTIAVL